MTLIPCIGLNKLPKHKGFLKAPYDPELEPQDNVNYQVLLSQRYLVVDCDPRHYEPKDDRPLNRLFVDCGLDPALYKDTFIVKTPSGGFHVYFTKHPDVDVVSTLKAYQGLEFKCKFIMAAGSYIERDKDGNPVNRGYLTAYKSPAEITPAPQLLLAKLQRKIIPSTLEVDVPGDSPADISAFTRHCEDAEGAIQGHNGDGKTYGIAIHGRSLGLSAGVVYNIMAEKYNPKCLPPWTEDELKRKIINAYQYSMAPRGTRSIHNEFNEPVPEGATVEPIKVKYQTNKDGSLKRSLANLKMFFNFPTFDPNPERKRILDIPAIGRNLGFDQFSGRIVWTQPAPWYKTSNEWDDQDASQFKMILSDQLHIEFGMDQMHEAATICARERAFHPVRDYVNSIRWDGVSRVDNWLGTYCGVLDNEYTRFIGRKTLVAAIARVFRPGCKFDHVLVFEGIQGIGKSYMWEIMASPWFTDAPLSIHDKGAVEVLQGKWVVELAEMDALSRYESQAIKGFFTRNEDRCRMAYERNAKSFPRQCIFVGSLNPEQTGWLKDRTGNRRYWPVPVTRIDLKGLKRDRDQLWAEALSIFEQGENIHVEDAGMRLLMSQMVDARMQEDPWFGIVEEYLHTNGQKYVNDRMYIIVPVLLYQDSIGGGAAAFSQREASRMASILKTLGFEKTKTPGKHGYVYTKTYNEEM